MRAITDLSLSWSLRFYKGLLRAYPQEFLTEFEDLLCQAFGDLADRAVRTKGLWGLFALWLRTVPDLISSAMNQRFRSNSYWFFRLRWIGGCTGGAIFGVAFMLVVWLTIDRVLMGMGMAPFPLVGSSYLLLLAASFGLILGLFQSFALGWKRSVPAGWTFATMLGAACMAGIVIMVREFTPYVDASIHPLHQLVSNHRTLFNWGVGLLCLSMIGFMQALVLARRGFRSLLWIPTSAIGIGTSVVLTGNILQIFYREHYSLFTEAAIVGFIVGTVYGLLTAIPLERILQQRVAQEAVSDGSQR